MTLDKARGEKGRGGSGSSSFLVRLSRVSGADEGTVRVYLRNLQTGEELYLGDPKRVGEVLAKEVEAGARADETESDTTSKAQAG